MMHDCSKKSDMIFNYSSWKCLSQSSFNKMEIKNEKWGVDCRDQSFTDF